VSFTCSIDPILLGSALFYSPKAVLFGIIITDTGVFSVSIVDVYASNSMARELAYGIMIITGWIPESFSSDRSASS